MQQAAQEWETRGIGVLGVVGQRSEPVQRLRTKRGIAFPILIDADRAVIKRFGVYHRLGIDAVNIARPAVFVLDAQGVVRWQHVARNQFDRPSVAQIDAALALAAEGQRAQVR
ncbi:redoxin domain-containing protein [bacterium]|nr:MAG: redoxin domain-containing protein [bacterium]